MFGLFGIGGGDRRNVMEFIKKVGSGFDLRDGHVRVGVRESCFDAHVVLSEFPDTGTYFSAVEESFISIISSLLVDVRMDLGKARPNANRIAILVVSGEIQDMEEAMKQVRRLKYNTRVIVVGIGNSVDEKQLMQLASSKNSYEMDMSHVFPVQSSKELLELVKKVQVLMCEEQ